MAENKLTKPDQAEKTLSEIIAATSKKNPKEEDLQTLRKMMKEDANIWQMYGDWAHQCELMIMRDYFESNDFLGETVERKLRDLRNELNWETSTVLEKLLIRQICITWLRLYYVERQHHQATTGSHSLTHGVYWDKRLSEVQKRHLKAIESLAKVRKMTAQTAKFETAVTKAKSAQTLNSIKILEAMTKKDN
jgi:hypothetical protein